MKAMLLRVGIDKGTDGTLGPIFRDGSFEYIPISEEDPASKESRTYENTIGKSGQPLSTYLPNNIKNRRIHFDPEFITFTYGDPTSKRRYLLKLKESDLLVFYAGLTPFNNRLRKEALYIIGYFTVDKVIDFSQASPSEIKKYGQLYSANPHFKRSYDLRDVVLVAGELTRSRLLDTAIIVSQKKLDKRGHLYHAVSRKMETALRISGSIQRSIPPRFIQNGIGFDNLEKILGLRRSR